MMTEQIAALRQLLTAIKTATVVANTRILRDPDTGQRTDITRTYQLTTGWTIQQRTTLIAWSSTRPSPYRHHSHQLSLWRDGVDIRLGWPVSLDQAIAVMAALGVTGPPVTTAADAALKALRAKLRAVQMVRCWRNEDGERFVFASDLRQALGLPVEDTTSEAVTK